MRQTTTRPQTPFVPPNPDKFDAAARRWPRDPLRKLLEQWLNRGLAADRRIDVRVSWPLWLLPLLLVNQLFAPHIVWVVLLIALSGFYVVGYLWVRNQTPALALRRRRVGSILIAGDLLQEEFELTNSSQLPLLWAEFIDHSTVPDYEVGRVVACEGDNAYRWRTEALCRQRGVFRLGPHRLRTHDPLGLFRVTIDDGQEDVVIIYPRVVHLPAIQPPHGNAQGGDRQRSPLLGNLPAATVSDYQRGDSLRHVHWVSTARRGRMMVKDLELEQSGNIWLVLDLDHQVQRGEGEGSTLEQGIVVAASLAAELLSGREQRAVGLLAYSGDAADGRAGGLVEVMPSQGSAHTWPILSALAPVAAGEITLGELLVSSRGRIGRGSTLMVITPVALPGAVGDPATDGHTVQDWVAELVRLKSAGVNSSVVLIAAADDEPVHGEVMRGLLARMEIGCTLISAGMSLPALLTFRRRRRIVRTTPTGGAVSYEVDEEVG